MKKILGNKKGQLEHVGPISILTIVILLVWMYFIKINPPKKESFKKTTTVEVSKPLNN